MKKLSLGGFLHDWNLTVFEDGKVTFALQIDRINRKKHSGIYTKEDILFCLKELDMNIEEFDEFVLANTNLFWKWERREDIKKYLDSFNKPIYIVDHHMAHLASAFYSSPFEEANIISIDWKWDGSSWSIAYGYDKKIQKSVSIDQSYSLWRRRSTMNIIVGFPWYQYSGKTMALWSLGKPVYVDDLMKFVSLNEDGTYFFHTWDNKDTNENREIFSNKQKMVLLIKERFWIDPVQKAWCFEENHINLVASLQKMTNIIVGHMVKTAYKNTWSKNLCLAWGVALNGIMNKSIFDMDEVDNLFIQPAASDMWLSLWAGQYINHQEQWNSRIFELFNPFLGRDIWKEDIKYFLEDIWEKIQYKESKNIFSDTATLLASNKIIAWVQDREEFWPRALWNRSILASPLNGSMKDIINNRIKHREEFRPFASAILEEYVSEYFEQDMKSPYMLLIEDIIKEKRDVIPAVTHSDWSWRLQTISKELSPKFHKLIDEFKNITWVPVLLNTSLNVNWEPIVGTTKDALNFFLWNNVDYLVIWNYIVNKKIIT